MEREDEVLEVMAKHWEELSRKREDTEAEMGGVGGYELVMCEEVSWKKGGLDLKPQKIEHIFELS